MKSMNKKILSGELNHFESSVFTITRKKDNVLMEKSDVSWVLVGIRPNGETKIHPDILSELLRESFKPERVFHLFICGAEVEKKGTLEEMEKGYYMVKNSLDEYREGDYCVISRHSEGDLLFMPTQMDLAEFTNVINTEDRNVENVSRNFDNLQE